MTTLEQEILQRYRQLDAAARQRVRAMLADEPNLASSTVFDFAAWQHAIETIRSQKLASPAHPLSLSYIVDTLRSIRDGDEF